MNEIENRKRLNNARSQNQHSSQAAKNSPSKKLTGGESREELEALIKNYEKKSFRFMLILAMISDLADGFWLTGLVFKPFIYSFLSGCGEYSSANIKEKIGKFKLLTLFDVFPFVGWLPLTTFAVGWTWKEMKKDYKQAKKKLSAMPKEDPNDEDYDDEDYD